MLLINKSELSRVLTVLSKVAPTKSSTPILKCARLQTVDRQTVSLTVTNLDEFFTCRIKVSDAPEGLDALLPIPEVKSFIKDNRRVLIQIEPIAPGGVSVAEITGGQLAKREFPAPETKDFPVLLLPCPEKMFTTPPDFIQTLKEVTPTISLADSRTVLHGFLLSKNGIVATDGRELCCVPYDLPLKGSCILPIPNCLFTAEFLKAATKLGTAQNGTHTWATIEVDDWSWTAKCIAGHYPNWKQVVPQDGNLSFSMTLDKSQTGKFADALKQLTNKDSLHMLQLKTDEDILEVFADCDPEQKTECRLIEATGKLPEDGIFVNRNLLVRALSLGHHTFTCNPEAYSPIVATGGLGKLVFMPINVKIDPVTVPNNEQQTHEPETNQMENETMKNNNATAPGTNKAATTETAKAPVIPATPDNGFKVVTAPTQHDSYDELLECVEELRGSIRTINEQAASLTRKIRDQQASFKRREKDRKAAREAIEKLKVSGF
ncbi:MAG: hypothetical protein WCI51_20195 [Lentisphaerota bacterium]